MLARFVQLDLQDVGVRAQLKRVELERGRQDTDLRGRLRKMLAAEVGAKAAIHACIHRQPLGVHVRARAQRGGLD
ncbi:hypothetical protein COLO4_01840, partial [Corchorus olitorius]